MTSNEFVAYMKGMAIGIEGTPTDEQWVLIIKALMKVKDPSEEGKNLITEIRTEVEKVVKPIIKKFPGSPPNILPNKVGLYENCYIYIKKQFL